MQLYGKQIEVYFQSQELRAGRGCFLLLLHMLIVLLILLLLLIVLLLGGLRGGKRAQVARPPQKTFKRCGGSSAWLLGGALHCWPPSVCRPSGCSLPCTALHCTDTAQAVNRIALHRTGS
jgi:hypothetical protein